MVETITFSDISAPLPTSFTPPPGLTALIRTDAKHATEGLRNHLLNHLSTSDHFAVACHTRDKDKTPKEHLYQVIRSAYEDWGRTTLTLLSKHMDYDSYGLTSPKDHCLNVHYYNAKNLKNQAIENAQTLISGKTFNAPLLFVSLDDMIHCTDPECIEIGFSRLFTLCGSNYSDYVGRPGMLPLGKQLEHLRDRVNTLYKENNQSISIILLEDNIRHAKMLNWIIDKMQKNGVFEHS